MKKNYILTFIAEFAVLLSQILVFKLSAVFLGKQGFGEYALTRRSISLIVPILLLGLGVGIPRYVAIARARTINPENPESYLISAFSMVTITVFIFLLAMNLLSKEVAYLFFGNQGYQYLIWPIASAIAGLCFHSLAYNYYRGCLKMLPANLLQLVNIGLVPPLVFVLPNISVSNLFSTLGLVWVTTSGMVILYVFRKNRPMVTPMGSREKRGTPSRRRNYSLSELKDNSKQLLGYGAVRVPGELGLMGFLSLPAFFTAHIFGVEKAGLVAFAITVLSLIGSIFNPLGLLLLPVASNQMAKRDLSLLKLNLKKLLKISLGLTFLIVLFLEVFAPAIIKIYLGKEFLEAAKIMRLVLIGAVPYVVYVIFRNASDALYVKPMNMKNVMIALSFFVVMALISSSFAYLVTALCGGLFILGVFTWYDVRRALNKGIKLESGIKI